MGTHRSSIGCPHTSGLVVCFYGMYDDVIMVVLCVCCCKFFSCWLPQNSSNSPGPIKGPTVAARLKHLQQGSLERPKTRKQKEDFPKVQGQQQVFHF